MGFKEKNLEIYEMSNTETLVNSLRSKSRLVAYSYMFLVCSVLVM